MNVINQFGEYNLTNKKNREIKYIVIHYTAGTTSKSGTAKNTAKYFNKETTKASADFIVDDEFVVQFNPDIKNKYCWHCGGSKYKTQGGSLYKICTSANSIGIEVCSSNSAKKVTNPNDTNWYFTDDAVKNTLELVKQLMQEYNIDVDHIIRHYDVNGKPCPGIIGWNKDTGDESKWEAFKTELIPAEIAKVEETVQDKTEVKQEIPMPTVGEVLEAIESVDLEPIEVNTDTTSVVTSEIKTDKQKDTRNIIEKLIDFIANLFKK